MWQKRLCEGHRKDDDAITSLWRRWKVLAYTAGKGVMEISSGRCRNTTGSGDAQSGLAAVQQQQWVWNWRNDSRRDYRCFVRIAHDGTVGHSFVTPSDAQAKVGTITMQFTSRAYTVH